jgi:hypothetical protein
MTNNDGTTKKTTDWLGREKEEHFDSSGNKIGETRFTKDWTGKTVQEHFNEDGEETGTTKAGSDWLGNALGRGLAPMGTPRVRAIPGHIPARNSSRVPPGDHNWQEWHHLDVIRHDGLPFLAWARGTFRICA